MSQTEKITTKNEYMKVLSHRLRHLPKEDYLKAMDYFEEYFAEAGPEHEQQAIDDLGSPEEAADALIQDLAVQNAKEPPKTVRGGLSAVWVGILAVCSAPITLPLAIALIILILALIGTAGIAICCLIVSAVAIAAAGILGMIGGIALLFRSFADGICNIGFGLFCSGAGILCIYGSVLFFRWSIRKTSVALGKITKRGSKK